MLTWSALMMLISQEEMKIQTYSVGAIPPAGQHNLIENKMLLSFLARGFPDTTIDPRAGRLEVAIRSKVEFAVERYTEFQPLEKCEGMFIESQIEFVETAPLRLLD